MTHKYLGGHVSDEDDVRTIIYLKLNLKIWVYIDKTYNNGILMQQSCNVKTMLQADELLEKQQYA